MVVLPPEALPNDSPDRLRIDGLSGSAKVLPKRLIDHRLVASARGVGPVAKHFEPPLRAPCLPIIGDEGAVRFFAHALGGFAHTSGVTPSQSSAEWVLGGGMDALFFRLQGDHVRLNVKGVNKGNARVFVGAVVPLCLRACSESKDGTE